MLLLLLLLLLAGGPVHVGLLLAKCSAHMVVHHIYFLCHRTAKLVCPRASLLNKNELDVNCSTYVLLVADRERLLLLMLLANVMMKRGRKLRTLLLL